MTLAVSVSPQEDLGLDLHSMEPGMDSRSRAIRHIRSRPEQTPDRNANSDEVATLIVKLKISTNCITPSAEVKMEQPGATHPASVSQSHRQAAESMVGSQDLATRRNALGRFAKAPISRDQRLKRIRIIEDEETESEVDEQVAPPQLIRGGPFPKSQGSNTEPSRKRRYGLRERREVDYAHDVRYLEAKSKGLDELDHLDSNMAEGRTADASTSVGDELERESDILIASPMDLLNSTPTPMLATPPRSQRSNRRRILDDEGDDNATDSPSYDPSRTSTQKGAASDIHSRPPALRQDAISPPPRLVILYVPTSIRHTITFVLEERLVRQIPEYAQKLNNVLQAVSGEGRLMIADTTIRDEEAMFQVVEYLIHGSLKPLLPHKATRMSVLQDLLTVHELSVALDLPRLSHAVVDHITASCMAFSVSDVVDLTIEYRNYKQAGNGSMSEKTLEQIMRTVLTRRMEDTIKSMAKMITETGGGDRDSHSGSSRRALCLASGG